MEKENELYEGEQDQDEGTTKGVNTSAPELSAPSQQEQIGGIDLEML